MEATGLVWARLVEALRSDHGVATLDDLAEFLGAPPPARGPRWTYPPARERRLDLPAGPGIYRFLDGNGSVLYVGKAASLHTRVNSYFRKRRAEEKLLELVSQVRDVAVTECPSAFEAALLEAGEIQRLDPPYNRLLRDTGQGVWFFSPDLARSRRRPGRGYPLGPVPSRDPFLGVGLLSRLSGLSSATRRLTLLQSRSLGVDPRFCEAGARMEGLGDFFRRQAGDSEAVACTTTGLLAAGVRLWREQRALRELEELNRQEGPEAGKSLDEESGELPGVSDGSGSADLDGDTSAEVDGDPCVEVDGDTSEKVDRLLGPADVADILEGTLRAAVRQRRRTRWFLRLCESTVAWDASDGSAGERRLVSVERGVPRGAEILGPGDPIPLPAGWGVPLAERRGRIDRAAYDRLRVLNSEMRRALRSGRRVEVRLGPKLLIGPELLSRILERV